MAVNWTDTTPKRLILSAWEESERAAAKAKNGGAGPVPYSPIPNPPAVYTHVGHDINYRAVRRNGRSVRLLILHTTETDSFEGSMRYNARRMEKVSATAYVGADGEIGYGVPEVSVPWTTGRWNDESLAMEICGKAAWSAAQWKSRPAQIKAIIDLLTDWCRRFNIPPTLLSDVDIAAGASKQGQPPVQGTYRGVCDHLGANLAARLLGASVSSTTHHDIGPGLREVVESVIMPEVAARLKPPPEPPTKPNPPEEEEMLFRFTTTNRLGQWLISSNRDVPLKLTAQMVAAIGNQVPKVVGDGPEDNERWDQFEQQWFKSLL